MTGNEECSIQEYCVYCAQFPQRLDPVVPAFAIQSCGTALKHADVATQMCRRSAVRELESLGCRSKPTRSLVVQKGKNSVNDVRLVTKRQLRKNTFYFCLGDSL